MKHTWPLFNLHSPKIFLARGETGIVVFPWSLSNLWDGISPESRDRMKCHLLELRILCSAAPSSTETSLKTESRKNNQ